MPIESDKRVGYSALKHRREGKLNHLTCPKAPCDDSPTHKARHHFHRETINNVSFINASGCNTLNPRAILTVLPIVLMDHMIIIVHNDNELYKS